MADTYYWSHKEIVRQKAKEYYERNRSRIRARCRQYYYSRNLSPRVKADRAERNLVANSKRVLSSTYISDRLESLIAQFGEEAARFYERVRLDVCNGISTKTLSPEDQDRWWGMLKARIAKVQEDAYEHETEEEPPEELKPSELKPEEELPVPEEELFGEDDVSQI